MVDLASFPLSCSFAASVQARDKNGYKIDHLLISTRRAGIPLAILAVAWMSSASPGCPNTYDVGVFNVSLVDNYLQVYKYLSPPLPATT